MGDKLGSLGQLCVLLDDPEIYKLPRNPTYTAARAWQEIVQPAAELSFVAGVEDVAATYVIARRNIRMEDVE